MLGEYLWQDLFGAVAEDAWTVPGRWVGWYHGAPGGPGIIGYPTYATAFTANTGFVCTVWICFDVDVGYLGKN